MWVELPMSRTIFYGPKDVRAIEVRLYEYFIGSSFPDKNTLKKQVHVYKRYSM